jgi:hypothetical protein
VTVKIRAGGWAWIGLTGYVLAADTALIRNGRETMSTVFGDSITNPIRRWPVMAAWGLLTVHLFSKVLPGSDKLRRVDPLGIAARAIGAP